MKIYSWIMLTGILAALGVFGNALGGLLDAPFLFHKYGGIVTAGLVLIHGSIVLYTKLPKKAKTKGK